MSAPNADASLETNPNGAGRPEYELDWKKIDEMLMCGCPGTEVASHFGIHHDTLYDQTVKKFNMKFSEYSLRKKQKGQGLLRVTQFKKALSGDNTLLIWLGKQYLEQKESPIVNTFNVQTLQKFDELMTQIDALQAVKAEIEMVNTNLLPESTNSVNDATTKT